MQTSLSGGADGSNRICSGDSEIGSFPSVRFGDLIIQCVSRADLVDIALSDCAKKSARPKLVFDANGHALSLAKTDKRYCSDVANADIVHADGGFLVMLSGLFRMPKIPERSATTDMLHDFSAAFRNTPYSFYLLGGEESINRQCGEILLSTYPGLKIAGRRNGFFTAAEESAVIEAINRAAPDVLWIGLGKPKEQAFCVRWRDQLKARWLITCGGCFNYVTGDYGRAPVWMQRMSMEWLYRMAMNPRKLFWRYVVTSPHAIWIAFRDHGANAAR